MTKQYLKPGLYIFTALEEETDHIGTDKIYANGKYWRPLCDRITHTTDEVMQIRKDAMEIIYDAFPEVIEMKKVIGTSWIVAYEFGGTE